MRLGEVIGHERRRAGISEETMSAALGISSAEYQKIEEGSETLEEWGPMLAVLAIGLSCPVAFLVSANGDIEEEVSGRCGRLIREKMRQVGLEPDELLERIQNESQRLGVTVSKGRLEEIMRGDSPIEKIGPMLHRISAQMRQPFFNLFCPYGIWYLHATTPYQIPVASDGP